MNTNAMLSFPVILVSLILTPTAINVGEEAVEWATLFEIYNTPVNNNYGSPASVTWTYNALEPSATVAIQTSKCAPFLVQSFLWGALLTINEIDELTTSANPNSAIWYDAIEAGGSSGSLSIDAIDIDEIERGDLVVGKYTISGSVSGHSMIVADVRSTAHGDTLSVVPASPADASDAKWLLTIYDSTRSPHGSTPSATAITQGVVHDSRNRDTDLGGGEDRGMGVGSIVIYTSITTGAITGWRWSYNGSYYTIANRPLIAGRITEAQ